MLAYFMLVDDYGNRTVHELNALYPGLLICKYQTGQKWPVPHYVDGS